MANYDKYMMVGSRVDIAKAFNSEELLSPCAVVMDGAFKTETDLYEDRFINEWKITVNTPNPTKSPAPTPTDFESPYSVAYQGEGLKTDELNVGEFNVTEVGDPMGDFYSYFPVDTALYFEDSEGKQYDLYHITSKGDYENYGEKFSFEENTESFTITWQDDIPGDKGEMLTGFVVRTTPYVDQR